MKTTDITVARTIPAPAAEVFDVWIDASSPGGPWFGAERVILNAVVDGLFYFAVKDGAKRWAHYGRFLRVERPRLVEYTWMSEATKGLETVVSVAFDARDGETDVTLRHTGVPDDEFGRQHQDGWGWILSALAERFGSKAAPAASSAK